MGIDIGDLEVLERLQKTADYRHSNPFDSLQAACAFDEALRECAADLIAAARELQDLKVLQKYPDEGASK